MKKHCKHFKSLKMHNPHNLHLFWGIGLSETDPDAMDPDKWQGQNLLGECLMRARKIILQTDPNGSSMDLNLLKCLLGESVMINNFFPEYVLAILGCTVALLASAISPILGWPVGAIFAVLMVMIGHTYNNTTVKPCSW